MKRYVLNIMTVIMVLILVLVPVISITSASSSEKDSASSARAESAPMFNEQEIDAQLTDSHEVLETLDERDWAIFQRLAELEPAQWERLCWLLEQYDNSRQLDSPAINGILTDYDIELVSYVMPNEPSISTSYGWLQDQIDTILEVITELGTWFTELATDTGEFLVDTIDGAFDIVKTLITKYQYFTETECEQLRSDLSDFVFGDDDTDLKGLDDILWDLVELVQWSVDIDTGIELPDLSFIEDTINGEMKIPCLLLFPVSLALEMTPNWQELPPTIYDFLPHPGEWPSMCDLLLAEPAVGNGTLVIKFILDGAVALFELIEVVVPDDLTIDIAGEGTTLPIAHPLKIVVGLTTKTLNLAAVLVDALYTKIENCGSDEFQGNVTASLVNIDADLAAHDTKISSKLDDAQWTLDNVVEHMDVDLHVIKINEKKEFLVSASEAGIPLEDVEFTYVLASKKIPVSFVDISAVTTVSMVQQGVYLVQIDLPRGIRDASIFAISVRHNNGEADHYGFILFDVGDYQ